MKQHKEIRWGEVARNSIAQKIEDLELTDKLTRNIKLTKKDVVEIAKKIDSAVAKKL